MRRLPSLSSALLVCAAALNAGQMTVTLDTSQLASSAAGPFSMAFQLADGSLSGDGNNSVVVSNIRLDGQSAGGGCAPQGPGGLLTSINLTDLNVFGTCEALLFPLANTISFDIFYTNNLDSGIPDEFVFSILDKNYQPIPTTGGIALVQIDFDGANPTIQTFPGDPSQAETANGGFGIPLPVSVVSNLSSLAPPVLTFPANGATNVPLTSQLMWNASTGATSYDVYFGTTSPPQHQAPVTSLNFILDSLLQPGTTYYWQIAAKNGMAVGTSPIWSFTTQQPVTAVPRAAFRDMYGAIDMASFPSPTLSGAGGVFASDPAVAEDVLGQTVVTARDTYNALWANVFNQQSQSWSGWQYGAGVFQGVPAVAVAPDGVAWIAARDTYNSYWINSYQQASGWGTWQPLLGVFSTDPVITACSTGGLYIIGKDNYNSLWSGAYYPRQGFTGWTFGGGIINGKPSATCGSDSAAYIAAEDFYNSNWAVRVYQNTWGTWYFGGAITSVPPRIAALSDGSEAVVILDSTNVVWRTTYTEGTSNGWQPWTQVGGILSDVEPAAAGSDLYLAGKAPNGDLWWWQQSNNQWTWIGNNGAAAGALAATPQ